jgi:hypothetical protein
MSNFKAIIYQLDKNSGATTFEYKVSGEITTEFSSNAMSEFLAHKISLLAEKQAKRKERGSKGFKLAKTKPLYFFFSVAGKVIFENEVTQSLKYNILLGTKENIQADICDLIDIIQDNEVTL